MLNGIVIVDKRAGITSHQEVLQIRRLFPGVKVGHTGTLDPMATGVLPICLGRATRLVEYIIEQPKSYRATVTFGSVTTTGDADGEIVAKNPVPPLDREKIGIIVNKFAGVQEQLPPLYSAVKYRGKPLYRWAREGSTVPRKSRRVEIYKIDIVSFSAESETQIVLDINCSKGTYIRTLAVDLGQEVGCGAHLAALNRLSVGPYKLSDALTTADLAKLVEDNNYSRQINPLDSALLHLPRLDLDQSQTELLRQGQAVLLNEEEGHHLAGPVSVVRIYDQEKQFRALARFTSAEQGFRLNTLKFLVY